MTARVIVRLMDVTFHVTMCMRDKFLPFHCMYNITYHANAAPMQVISNDYSTCVPLCTYVDLWSAFFKTSLHLLILSFDLSFGK